MSARRVLHAANARQTGLATVIATGYDPTTALWPEAINYGIGVTTTLSKFPACSTGAAMGNAVEALKP